MFASVEAALEWTCGQMPTPRRKRTYRYVCLQIAKNEVGLDCAGVIPFALASLSVRVERLGTSGFVCDGFPSRSIEWGQCTHLITDELKIESCDGPETWHPPRHRQLGWQRRYR